MQGEKPTRARRLIRWLENHRIIGPVLAICIVVLALIGASTAVKSVVDLFKSAAKVQLNLSFLTESGLSENLEIQAAWLDGAHSGFSQPVPLQLTVCNSGRRTASNVHVYLRYNKTTLSLSTESGELLPGAILESAPDVHKGTYVAHYALDDIPPGGRPLLFEKTLHASIQTRLRIGFPYIPSELPLIGRVFMDVADVGGEWGIYEIRYEIECSECIPSQTGILTIDANPLARSADLPGVDVDSLMDIDGVVSDLPFDPQLPEATRALSSAFVFDRQEPISSLVSHFRSGDLEAVCLAVDGYPAFYEVDEDGDGLLDYAYMEGVGTDVGSWYKLSLSAPVAAVEYDEVTDFTEGWMDHYVPAH